jgi:hypothetical protein
LKKITHLSLKLICNVKTMWEIFSNNFVAFSEYLHFVYHKIKKSNTYAILNSLNFLNLIYSTQHETTYNNVPTSKWTFNAYYSSRSVISIS